MKEHDILNYSQTRNIDTENAFMQDRMGNMVSEYYYLTKSKNKSIITKDNIFTKEKDKIEINTI